MPAQKRKDLASDGDDEEKREDEEVKEEIANGEVKEEGGEEKEEIKDEKEEKVEEDKVPEEKVADPQVKEEDSDADGNSQSSNSAGDGDEFVLVKLAEVRKEVQCPICLGIIRKTRTVMECLHRFCRDCIDKSMRLSNNECPACRTHCASRRSLRDDPNFDALISALYPDIDKYEEEELAFCEEERSRNQKIQETIAETFRRQTEALGKKKAQRARFPRRRARGRGRSSGPHLVINEGSEDDQEMNINGDEGGGRDKDSSFSEDDDVALVSSADVARPKKRAKRSSKTGNSEDAGEENEDPMTGVSSPSPSKAPKEKEKETGVSSSSPFKPGNKDLPGASSSPLKASSKELTGVSLSPLRTGNMEVLSWGKNGTRSSLAGRLVKNPRVSKLIEHLRNIDDNNNNNNERDVHVSLVPLNGESMPGLEMLYICCKQNISVQLLCQFVAVNLSQKAEDIEIYAKRPNIGPLETEGFIKDMSKLEILQPEKCISELKGNLELIYGLKVKN